MFYPSPNHPLSTSTPSCQSQRGWAEYFCAVSNLVHCDLYFCVQNRFNTGNAELGGADWQGGLSQPSTPIWSVNYLFYLLNFLTDYLHKVVIFSEAEQYGLFTRPTVQDCHWAVLVVSSSMSMTACAQTWAYLQQPRTHLLASRPLKHCTQASRSAKFTVSLVGGIR